VASSERDRLEQKFEKVDNRFSELEDHFNDKFNSFDNRLDTVEKHQAAQNEKLGAIHAVTLANNEALEQKLNLSTVTTQMVREIVDARINSFQESIKYLQTLIEQIIKRDCNLP
jgi:tetrahydromethanopterin S-methyltransferase subunit B